MDDIVTHRMTTRTITNEPLTVNEAVAHLNNMYKTATQTGAASQNPHYQELARDLHDTIMSIMQGVDPTEAMRGLADVWRVAARDTPDGPTSIRTYSWVAMITHLVRP